MSYFKGSNYGDGGRGGGHAMPQQPEGQITTPLRVSDQSAARKSGGAGGDPDADKAPRVDRSGSYKNTGPEPDQAMETLSQRLASDLRRQIKRLGTPSLLTAEWFEVVEALQHITNIAVMEQRLPQKHGEDATLWERDDLTVRYMLEEGKLNVTLRQGKGWGVGGGT